MYETVNFLFERQQHVYYFTNCMKPNERWHSFMAVLPWEQKLDLARRIVDFHWRNRTKGERAWIAEQLARGRGDLSFLQSFSVSIDCVGGKWTYQYCTCSLSGPNYDYCRRKYLQSL